MFVTVVVCFMLKRYIVPGILLELESSMGFVKDSLLVFEGSFLCLKCFSDFVEAMTCLHFFLTNCYMNTNGRVGYVR